METLIELSSYSMAMQQHNKSPWECATVRSVVMALQKNTHWSETLPVVKQSFSEDRRCLRCTAKPRLSKKAKRVYCFLCNF